MGPAGGPLENPRLRHRAISSAARYADYLIIVKFAKPAARREYLFLAGFHLLAFAGLAATGLLWAAVIWYFSLVTSFMMFFRLRLWLEHQGTAGHAARSS